MPVEISYVKLYLCLYILVMLSFYTLRGDISALSSYTDEMQLSMYGCMQRLFSLGSTYVSLVVMTCVALLPDLTLECVESVQQELDRRERLGDDASESRATSCHTEITSQVLEHKI